MRKGIITFAIAILAYGAYLWYKTPVQIQGEKAINFHSTLLNGKSFALEQLKGTYVLLDFWGSWCGPCRKENPELVKLHQQFHNKTFRNAQNFHIVSVAVERDCERSKKAILKDALSWEFHICDGKRFKSELTKTYNIREIPTKYLIGPEGFVLGINPSMAEINDILSSQLSNN